MMVTEFEVAWLAGLLDGEGSVGASLTPAGKGKSAITVSVQMSITCRPTLEETLRVIRGLGVIACGYTYQERDPTKHLDAYYLRVTRLLDIATLAERVRPYSVTKRAHWDAMHEFVASRLLVSTTLPSGRARRGGNYRKRAFSTREIELAKTLKVLNARGPGAKVRADEWFARLGSVERAA